MKIEHPDGPPEVLFGDLKEGDVFTDRTGKPHIKITEKEIRVDEGAKHRHNVLALDLQPWVTWFEDCAYVRYHPDAKLALGDIAPLPKLGLFSEPETATA